MPARKTKQGKKGNDDIPGLVAVLTTPFVIASCVAITLWVIAQGLLLPQWAAGLAVIVGIAVCATLKTIYAALLGGSISRPGCFAGLLTYGVGWVVWGLMIWQGGSAGVFAGMLLVPVACLGVAMIAGRNPPRRRGR